MLQVSYIVNRLTDKQAQCIALVLEENHGYADISLDIFEAYRVSLLTLCIEADQKQLLNAHEESVSQLIESCHKRLKSLPFGFTKLFLNNILLYLKIKKCERAGENKLALKKLQALNTSAIEAYNFNLCSSHFKSLEKKLQKPKDKKRQNYLTLIKNPLNEVHFENRSVSGNRLSYS